MPVTAPMIATTSVTMSRAVTSDAANTSGASHTGATDTRDRSPLVVLECGEHARGELLGLPVLGVVDLPEGVEGAVEAGELAVGDRELRVVRDEVAPRGDDEDLGEELVELGAQLAQRCWRVGH